MYMCIYLLYICAGVHYFFDEVRGWSFRGGLHNWCGPRCRWRWSSPAYRHPEFMAEDACLDNNPEGVCAIWEGAC